MKNKKITLPPHGYRKLARNEIIFDGDIFYGSDPLDDLPKLHKSLSVGFTPAHSVWGYVYFRKNTVKEKRFWRNPTIPIFKEFRKMCKPILRAQKAKIELDKNNNSSMVKSSQANKSRKGLKVNQQNYAT